MANFFVDLAQLDLVHAVKALPEVAAGLVAAAVTFLGLLLALFGFLGSKPTIVSWFDLEYFTYNTNCLSSLGSTQG